jgi:hypothetical protein
LTHYPRVGRRRIRRSSWVFGTVVGGEPVESNVLAFDSGAPEAYNRPACAKSRSANDASTLRPVILTRSGPCDAGLSSMCVTSSHIVLPNPLRGRFGGPNKGVDSATVRCGTIARTTLKETANGNGYDEGGRGADC